MTSSLRPRPITPLARFLGFVAAGIALLVALTAATVGLRNGTTASPRNFGGQQGPSAGVALMATDGSFASRVLVPQTAFTLDGELATVVRLNERLHPTTSMTASTLFHAVHLFGPSATVLDTSGKPLRALDVILDGRVAKRYFGSESVLTRTRYGVAFRPFYASLLSASQETSEAHPGQGLAVLAEAGIPLNTPIYDADGQAHLVSDILSDVEAQFQLKGEFFWDAVALTLYTWPRASWTNKFGERFSCDDVANALLKCKVSQWSCGGTHSLIALTVLLRADRERSVLASHTRMAVENYLRATVASLRASQLSEGGWPIRWYLSSASPQARVKPIAPMKVILATGHHLEWLIRLPSDLQPDDGFYALCGERLLRLWRDELSMHVPNGRNYCPMSHAGHVLMCLAKGNAR
jgi:hypothetical protein